MDTGHSTQRPGRNQRGIVVNAIFMMWFTTTVVAADRHVPWLIEVRQVPGQVAEPLSPALNPTNEAWTPARWATARTKLLADWKRVLGPMPARPQNTSFRVLRTDALPQLTRELIEYENEPGQFVQAYLLRPTGGNATTGRPGLVALHPTTNETIEPIAGVVGEERQHLGLKLAQRGFIVLCPRCFLWQDVKSYTEAVTKFQERHPQTLGMHKMLYDAQRATDILAALPEVDAKRLGAVGHSLGAKEALYLTAFDDRIRAAVASEGGIGLKSTNWDAPWYLGPTVKDGTFPRNHHELIALIAPRPFLVIAGEQGNGAADGERSWPYLQAAEPIYRLTTDTPAIGLLNHRQGHPLPLALFPKIGEWFETYLAP